MTGEVTAKTRSKFLQLGAIFCTYSKVRRYLLYLSKQLYNPQHARPDVSTAIAFLTTRVRDPDIDDWRKLSHLVEYLRVHRLRPLIMSADGCGVLMWYVDASFAVHPNMRSHTGGGLTLGRGFPIVISTKQKLNTKSSTESEIVGVDDMMPIIV